MERSFKKGDIVKHFKRETISKEELKKIFDNLSLLK